MGQSPGDSLGCRRLCQGLSRWRIHFREARLRDLDLDDSRKRGHVDVHLEFLHSSNSPPPTAAFPALCEVGETIEPRSFAAFR